MEYPYELMFTSIAIWLIVSCGSLFFAFKSLSNPSLPDTTEEVISKNGSKASRIFALGFFIAGIGIIESGLIAYLHSEYINKLFFQAINNPLASDPDVDKNLFAPIKDYLTNLVLIFSGGVGGNMMIYGLSLTKK